MALTTEGYVATIKLDSSSKELRFTIDPTVPYLIENGEDKDKREIIFRDDSAETKVVSCACEFLFKAPKGEGAYNFDANSLLIMKACHVKVRLTVASNGSLKQPVNVAELFVLR